MCNFISQLKMNILLPTQVMNGPFDACGVDFDVFWNVDMGELGFDVLFPSGAI